MSRAEATPIPPSGGKAHWEAIYRTRDPTMVSWFEAEPTSSLHLIADLASDREAPILDVGGGASRLVDALLARGYRHLTVLDVSGTALALDRERLGKDAGRVTWLESDVRECPLPDRSVEVWHDRALFHFLTDEEDRRRYLDQVRRVLRPGGHAIVATFAETGPLRCSGLEVVRYGPNTLQAEFGPRFALQSSAEVDHLTPSRSVQRFHYGVFRLRRES